MKQIVPLPSLFVLVIASILTSSDSVFAQRRAQQNNNRSASSSRPTPAATPIAEVSEIPEVAEVPVAESNVPTATERGIVLEAITPKPKSWAVLVGVNDYVKLSDLNYCVNDIKAIETSLLQTDFNKDYVFLLTSGAAEKNLPTRNNIVQVIQLVCQSAGPDDFVFISLNGHGIQIGDVQYFCPSDTDDQEDRLEETAISIDWIYTALQASQAKFKLLVADACRDNPFKGRRSALVADMGLSRDPPPGIALLRSCGPGETSLEDANLKKGVFTHFLLEGLTGAADMNNDGVITFLELYMYTQSKTQTHALREHRSRQSPYFKGEVSDFPFVRTFAQPAADVPSVAQTPVAATPSDPQSALMIEMFAELRSLREERNVRNREAQENRIRELEEQIEAIRNPQPAVVVQNAAPRQAAPRLTEAEVNRLVNKHVWTTPKIADDVRGLKEYVRQHGKLPRWAMQDLPPAKRQQMRHLYD